MEKELFTSKLKEMPSKIDEQMCKTTIQDSLRKIPDDLNQTGTMNLIIVMEELAELQQEISKTIRGKGDRTHLLEEMSDVYLGIKYLQEIFDIDDRTIARASNVKMDRQSTRNGFRNKEDDIQR